MKTVFRTTLGIVVAVVMSCSAKDQATAVAAEPTSDMIVIDENTPGYPGVVVGVPGHEIVIDENAPGYPGVIVMRVPTHS